MKILTAILFLCCSFSFAKGDNYNYSPSKMLPAFSYQLRADNAVDTFRFKDTYSPIFLTEDQSLISRKGKRTIVFFFSAVCKHCQQAISKLLKLKPLFAENNVDLIAIATKSNKLTHIQQFISRFKVKVPIFHDKKQSFARRYGIGVVPVVMVINEKGNYFRINPFHSDKLKEMFEHIFGDKALFPKK